MSEQYLLASGGLFLVWAIIWSHDGWANLMIKLLFTGMSIWAGLLWLAIHGAVRL